MNNNMHSRIDDIKTWRIHLKEFASILRQMETLAEETTLLELFLLQLSMKR